MTFEEFENKIRGVEQEIVGDPHLEAARMLESEALQFVDNNFRNQGWEGGAWKASKGTILVKSGRLRGGFQSFLTPGEVRVMNDVPYARIHNEGLSGVSQVKQHTRSRQKSSGKGKRKISSKQEIGAHQRNYNMPQRQFAPTPDSPSASLNAAVRERLSKYVQKLFEIM